MTVSTLVGVGKADSEVRPTLAAVVAESTASVAVWIRAAPMRETAGSGVAGGVAVGVRAARPGGRWSGRTATTAATTTRKRQARTTVAVKTRLRRLLAPCSSCPASVSGSARSQVGLDVAA